jgi:hypothetical protein
MRISNKVAVDKKISLVQLLWLPAAFPLLMVLCSLILSTWSWGLMDDFNMISIPGGVLGRTSGIFKTLLLDWGVFRPVHFVHMAVFYTLFEDHARWFYLFRWLEVVAALAVWGWLAVLITGRRLALPLLICITLCFYKFYDAFFFLSSQEYLGLLLAGCAGICFYKAFSPAVSGKGAVSWPVVWWGVFWLILSFGCKETFLVMGLAWGISLIYAGIAKPRSRSLWAFGSALAFGSIVYGIFLKSFVTAEHTSHYSLTDFGKFAENIVLWFKVDLVYHAPWIILTIVLMMLGKEAVSAGLLRRWAIVLGAGLYVGYVLILLPWDTSGFYSTPLGLLFAFFITVLIAGRLERMNTAVFPFIVAAALILNLLVGGSALQAQATYQQDSASLMKWLATNTQFEYEVNQNGAVVRANAMEPGGAIPALVRQYYGKTYGEFIFTPHVKEIVEDIQTRYYLYGTTWGDQDLSRLGKMWYPVFVSKNWIMFRRLY